MPEHQAHHLITTSGILGSAATGCGAVVLTLRCAPRLGALPLTAIALGELVAGLAAAVLIAVCARARPGGTGQEGKEKQD